MTEDKIVDWHELVALRERWGAEGKTVVWTNGCFDIMHVGHVHSLEAAKLLGDVLVVGVNSDDSVRRLKGPERPILPARDRMRIVAAFTAVDRVVEMDAVTAEEALERLRPDIHCKGSDHFPPSGPVARELEVVQRYGGRMEFTPLVPAVSTTDIIQRIRSLVG